MVTTPSRAGTRDHQGAEVARSAQQDLRSPTPAAAAALMTPWCLAPGHAGNRTCRRQGAGCAARRSVNATAIPLRNNDQRLGLDLDFPAGIEQPSDNDHRRRRADVGEQPPVFGADSISSSRIGQVHPRPNDGREISACLGERFADDLKAAPCLRSCVVGARPVRPDRSGSRYQHAVADTHGSREADAWFERGTRGDVLAVLHKASIADDRRHGCRRASSRRPIPLRDAQAIEPEPSKAVPQGVPSPGRGRTLASSSVDGVDDECGHRCRVLDLRQVRHPGEYPMSPVR